MRRFFLKLIRRHRMEQELEAELAFHREMSESNNNPIPLGNVTVVQEQARDLWRFTTIENIGRDLIYAARGLRRSPGFLLTALLSLGLGIGVNTAMFSLAVEVLFSEPSVRDVSTLVAIRLGNGSHMRADALRFLADSNTFESITGHYEESYINWDDGQDTRRLFAVQATHSYFTTLGIPVALGRGWNAGDPQHVAVLSHRFWRRHYAGDPAVIGRMMRLNGRAYTVLGVLPENHRTLVGYGFSPDLYVPVFQQGTILAAYARLTSGMPRERAVDALGAVVEQLDRDFPGPAKYASRIEVIPVGAIDRLKLERKALTLALFLGLLLVLVGLVLLIACVNVASLLLARASTRRHEIAIRLSLGASRGRLLQQFLAESALLSLAGAAVGFALAQVVATALASIPLPMPIPIRLHIEPDWRVATYAALLAIGSTIVTGLLPAWQSVRESLRADLQRESRLRLRRGLVALQIGVSLIVLTTGALFLRNLMQSSAMSPGFDVTRTIRADTHLPPEKFPDAMRINPFIANALQELRAVPGVEVAAAARIVPFTGATNHGMNIVFQDTGERRHVQFHWNAVSPEYFAAMDIPMLAGRTFPSAGQTGTRPAIVNKTFADRYIAGRNPVGVRFLMQDARQIYEIAGVVAGTKNLTIGEEDKPQLYESLSLIANDRPRIQFVVRSAIPPALQLAPVRQALRRLEPGAGVEVATMYSSIGLAFLPSQIGAALMGGIGVLGLMLAVIGLYGVTAYSVARRTREIGIRVAIGANSGTISAMVLSETGRLLLTGALPGLIIALFVTRPLAMFFVPGLSPTDPVTFVVVLCVLFVSGIAASLGPLRRAIRIDPARCLRYE